MRRVVVNEFMSLDGVVQAPGGADEDTSGGFAHGGWHLQYLDDLLRQRVLEGIAEAGAFLLGRRTWEIFAAYWPHAPEEERVIAEPLNAKPKYVASRTLVEPLAWENSTLLAGDVAEAVAGLKREEGGDVHVIGSSELVRALIGHGLVDELRAHDRPARARRRQAPLPRRQCPQVAPAGRRAGREHGRDPRDVRPGRLRGGPARPV